MTYTILNYYKFIYYVEQHTSERLSYMSLTFNEKFT